MNNENKLLGSVLLGLLEGKLLGNAINDIIKKYDYVKYIWRLSQILSESTKAVVCYV